MSDIHAETTPFVRETMLPPAAPPVAQSGVVLWLRTNMFSGPVNTVLTLLGLAIIWFLIQSFGPWLSRSVWNADNLRECRAIIAETWGEGKTGACFAMIRERWHQFLFGFYPRELFWRPVLTLGLLLIALVPILFSVSPQIRRGVLAVTGLVSMFLMAITAAPLWAALLMLGLFGVALFLAEYRPNWLLIATAFYPVVAVWLLWGGSLWTSLSWLLGLAVGYGVWRAALRPLPGLAPVLGLVALGLWLVFVAAPLAHALGSVLPMRLTGIDSDQFGGFLLAVVIGVSGIAMSLPLGIILALARRSDMFIVKSFAVMFIEFIRGVPLITLLFVASLLLNYFLPPGTGFDIILRVIIMVTIFAAAYMAEVIRGGLAALPAGQYEAADALGLTYWQAQQLIILPQALKISIPGIVGTFIGMFKDTTLVGLIGLFDPLKGIPDFVRSNFAWKGVYWEPFIFTGAIFFVICFAMSRYSMYLERRLSRGHN